MDGEPTRSPRKSLTKRQLEHPEAIELLALLQTITEDGRLLDDEVEALHDWLGDHADSTLPGVAHLIECVEAVLEDGRVSAEERKWLQKAVETVMPREEREYAAMRRREARADDRRSREAAEEREREEAQRNRPIASFDFMVAGVLYEGRASRVHRECSVGDEVFLAREPTNPYSRNAILVLLRNGHEIGHVPEADASRLAPLLDEGGLQSAEIKKILPGRKAPIPVVWGEVYRAEASLPDLKPPGTVGHVPSATTSTGCSAALLLVGILSTLISVL